jgi:hypothetical protein
MSLIAIAFARTPRRSFVPSFTNIALALNTLLDPQNRHADQDFVALLLVYLHVLDRNRKWFLFKHGSPKKVQKSTSGHLMVIYLLSPFRCMHILYLHFNVPDLIKPFKEVRH